MELGGASLWDPVLVNENSSLSPSALAENPKVLAPGEGLPPRDCEAYKTPSFQQYWKLRDSLPEDCLLFFRMGDFYELFAGDAQRAAPILGIQLTARAKDKAHAVPMCGVPFHSSDGYIEKLLSQGLKVAIAEQIGDVGKSKLVERDIVRVLTPALPFEIGKSETKKSQPLLVLGMQHSLDFAAFDLLSSQVWTGSAPEDFGPDELKKLLEQLDPPEILLTESQKIRLKDWAFLWDPLLPWSRRVSVFGVESKDSLALLKDYLVFTQRAQSARILEILGDSKSIWAETSWYRRNGQAQLSTRVATQWNLPELVTLLDSCGTAMGSRRLRHWLYHPLTEVPRLESRDRALRAVWDQVSWISVLKEIYDLDRLSAQLQIAELTSTKVTLKTLVQLRHSTLACRRLAEGLEFLKSPEWKALSSFEKLEDFVSLVSALGSWTESLERGLPDDVATLELHEAIQDGFDSKLDDYRSLHDNASAWMESFEKGLKDQLQIPSLKVRFNRVFGYYIEVTKTHLGRVPAHFLRKQTTVQGERFTTPELQEREKELLSATRLAETRTLELIQEWLVEGLRRLSELRKLSHCVATLDTLLAVAQSCRRLERWGPWVSAQWKPDQPLFFESVDLRHPLIENLSGGFVPNSVSLGLNHKCLLLTGPNMAGKSTLMRQVGLAMLLAQAGFPVPAQSFVASPASGFYSRMGASDRILEGESTFMVEMKETAEILKQATPTSLVLVDEIGRGTSTQDGLAIAKAVFKTLVEKTKSLTLFATHYHELADWSQAWPSVENASMAVQEWKGELVFLRRLDRKPAASSYGLWVAKMAGLPSSALMLAQQYFKDSDSERNREAIEPNFKGPQLTLGFEDDSKLPRDHKDLQEKLGLAQSELKDLASWPVDDLSPRELYSRFLKWQESWSQQDS